MERLLVLVSIAEPAPRSSITLQVLKSHDDDMFCASLGDVTMLRDQPFNIYIQYSPVYRPSCTLSGSREIKPFHKDKANSYVAQYEATAAMSGRHTYSCQFYAQPCDRYYRDYCEYDDDYLFGLLSETLRVYGVRCQFTVTVAGESTIVSSPALLRPIDQSTHNTPATEHEQVWWRRRGVWVCVSAGAAVCVTVLGVALLARKLCARGRQLQAQSPDLPVQYNIYSSDVTTPDPTYEEISTHTDTQTYAHTQKTHPHTQTHYANTHAHYANTHAHYANTHSTRNDYVNTHTTTQPSKSDQEPAYCEVVNTLYN